MNIYSQLTDILGNINLPSAYKVQLGTDWTESGRFHRYFMQVGCYRKDIITGEWGWGFGGKAYLSEHMVRSEVVATVFGLYKAYLEHEARETFTYKGKRVYGPHIDVEALVEIASRVEFRKNPNKSVEDS